MASYDVASTIHESLRVGMFLAGFPQEVPVMTVNR
jgi:hypothetical protein